MPKLEVLLFDVDGTLADTERDGHRVAFNRAFEQAGLDWHWSVARYGELLAVTGGKERMRRFLSEEHPDWLARPDIDAFIAELHQSKTAHYTNLMLTGCIPLRPGVERLLREAREQGLRLGVATTTTPENVSALISSALSPGAMDWFEVIAAGDIVPAKKPAPDIYNWAMQQLGVRPEVCAAFEDSDNGVRSVVDSGIRTLLVTVNDYTRGQDFGGASSVLEDLGEPGRPAVVLDGARPAAGHVDIDWLRELHSRG